MCPLFRNNSNFSKKFVITHFDLKNIFSLILTLKNRPFLRFGIGTLMLDHVIYLCHKDPTIESVYLHVQVCEFLEFTIRPIFFRPITKVHWTSIRNLDFKWWARPKNTIRESNQTMLSFWKSLWMWIYSFNLIVIRLILRFYCAMK